LNFKNFNIKNIYFSGLLIPADNMLFVVILST